MDVSIRLDADQIASGVARQLLMTLDVVVRPGQQTPGAPHPAAAVQGARLLVEPLSGSSIKQYRGACPGRPVPTGLRLELGDLPAGARVLADVHLDVPVLPARNHTRVAQLTLEYFEVPSAAVHRVTWPVLVDVIAARAGVDPGGRRTTSGILVAGPGATTAAPRMRYRATADGRRRAQELRSQLLLERSHAAALAAATLDILQRGSYRAAGRIVDVSGQMQVALDAARAIPAELELPALPPASLPTTTVQVMNATTLDAAGRLARAGRTPLALNLANGVTPGGGFRTGSRAQEEYLCRSTGLYPTLLGKPMYAEHRARADYESSHAAVLSPGVPVIRNDDGALLSRPWPCHFVSMAAPVAHRVGQPRSAQLLADRIVRLLHIAVSHGHRDLVLGAWGCGAFGNDPARTAEAFAEALAGPFAGQFDEVVFAITDWSDDRSHLGPFRDVFAQFGS